MSSDTFYGIDPIFNDTTDFISCEVCGREFDHNEYRSLTCSECESEQINERKRANK